MIWLLGGYMWLFIHRPFEVWPWLGVYHIERVYMIVTLLAWGASSSNRCYSNRLNAAFGFFFAVMLASWASGRYDSGEVNVVQEYAKVGLVFLLVTSCVRNEADLKRLLTLFLGAVALYATHSLREYLCGRYEWRMGTRRMIGVDSSYSDPNAFASTLVCALPMVLPFWYTARENRTRAVVIALFSLCGTCILLTGSRTGLVVFVCLLLGIVLTNQYRWRVLLVVCLLAPLVWSLLPEDRQNRYMTLIDPSYGPKNAQQSAEGRSEGWWDGVALWQQHFLLGVGPGVFGQATGKGGQPHHLYGQVLGELGTLGAAALLGLIVCFLRNLQQGFQIVREVPDLRGSFSLYVSASAVVTICLMLLLGFGGHNLYRYQWLWMGGFQSVSLLVLSTEQCIYRQAVSGYAKCHDNNVASCEVSSPAIISTDNIECTRP